jgi:hypothetical protein
MMKANSHARAVGLALTLGVALALSGCWDDDDDDDGGTPVVVDGEVPDSAGASSTSFIEFIQGLGSDDETSEPLTIREGFTVPADDDGEPVPLTGT